MSSGKHLRKLKVIVRAGATAVSFYRDFMKFRYLTVIITGPTGTARQEVYINNMLHWLMYQGSRENGRHTI